MARHTHMPVASEEEAAVVVAVENENEIHLHCGNDQIELPSSLHPPVPVAVEPVSRPQLTKVTLAMIMFYNVSGGPFGVEESVKAGGAFYTLLFFIIVPFMWSLQESLVTAELSVAFPHSSGGCHWTEEAFGPFAGWLNGMLSWVSGATDNAIYPVLFLDYLLKALPDDAAETARTHPFYRFILLSILAICLGFMNWRGLDIVGNVSLAICVLALSPFVFLTLLGIPKVDPSRWMEMPSLTPEDYQAVSEYSLEGGFFPNATMGGVLLRPFLNNLFWNFNSFDAVGAFSTEVGTNPEKVIPPALFITWIMTLVGYFLPLLVAIGASTASQVDWSDGYLTTVATEVVGRWLGNWTVFAAGISNLALYQAELSADVFQLYGMANKGMLPSFLGKRSQHGTPTNAIIFATIVVIIFSMAHLDKLIEMLNLTYSFAILMVYASFVKLRISKPDVPRPYRVPLSTLGCILLLIPTIFATVVVMLLASYTTILVGVLTVAISSAMYLMFEKQIKESPHAHMEVSQLTQDIELI